MVKVALSGGSGNVGREILDALIARKQHEILILSRKDAPAEELAPEVKWIKTAYNNVASLTEILQGVETVLSFIAETSDPKSMAQKNLIDASVRAGVRRFAPSEWSTAHFEHMNWSAYKEEIRKYLAEVNKDKKVLEYTLFQPGMFTNYMTYPFNSSKHVQIFETPFNFHQRRAIICEGGEDSILTLTTVQDTAKVVALAMEYEGEWPFISGIQGTETTVGQLIALGEEIRGGPFHVEKLKPDDLEAGVVKSSWRPEVTHKSLPQEMRDKFSAQLLSGVLLGFLGGAFKVSAEWNQLLPDFKFTQPEEFLTEAWSAIDAGAQNT